MSLVMMRIPAYLTELPEHLTVRVEALDLA